MGCMQRGQTDKKALPPEETGDSQHSLSSSHITQTLSNVSSLVGMLPCEPGQQREESKQSSVLGGPLDVDKQQGLQVELSHEGCWVNVKQ